MHEKRIGGLDVRIVDDNILFSAAGNPDNVLRLDNAMRQQLIDFLASYHAERREERVGFRVPISDELFADEVHLLRVVASHAGQLLEVRSKDISLSGLGFEWTSDVPATLTNGELLQLEIEFGDTHLKLPGKVRRLDRALMGVSFENEIFETEFDPPDELIHVIRQLETCWLRMTRKTT